MRALKSTLRFAWKMDSDLRIVDVRKKIFSNSSLTPDIKWSGLRVMVHGILTIIFYSCAGGQRGYQSIIFHSPIPHFGFKYRGLPFESMFEEVGRDLGNRLGKYIESDKRSWLLEQAKFMRIRVDLPINKPLRRGGNIVNSDGEKYWVTFKYERLPSFCFFFQCGFLGHDEKHCTGFFKQS